MHIHEVDLNLLCVFDALMQELNVTRAGERLGLSQPSVSHALARLRKLWADPLFTRTAAGVEPTPYARQIAEPIRQGLARLEQGINIPSAFDPTRSERTFHLLISDIGEVAYLPPLLARFQTVAPLINLRVLALPREQYSAALGSGEADLAIGFLPGLKAGFYQQRLMDDSYVCLTRSDHPRIRKSITLQQFSEESHVLVEPAGSRLTRTMTQSSTTTLIERHLSQQGLQRRIALRVPHFVVVPVIVQSSDLLATVPSYVMSSIITPHNLKTVPLPFAVPRFDIKQFWHERNHYDAANQWLRQTVAALFMGKSTSC